MSKLTLDEAIKHCLEVAEENDLAAGTYEILAENNHNTYERLTAETNSSRCTEYATDQRQLAEWLMEVKDLREENKFLIIEFERLIKENEVQIAEYKRLLKAVVEDFSKLDRENARNKNCMIPEIDCADCPLRWDSVDDNVEPCHNWQYTKEALKLIGDK